ncbi:YciI family protein [Aliarcobacter cryaerophilus]|uniref:YciI family protein n=1 Tax=Aliarcobacter cryaerophilus TaxID=28198 RepID=UPI003DA1EDC9
MQFLIIAYDYDDALERRMQSREQHIINTKKMMESGNIVSAGALIEDDKMVGSSLFVDFDTDEELDLWLEDEPYVVNRVWNMDEIQIVPVKLLPKN